MPSSATYCLHCDGDAAAAVHRERDQQRAALRHGQRDRPTSRTASTTIVVGGPAGRGQSAADRDQGRRALSADGGRRANRRRPAAADQRGAVAAIPSAASTDIVAARRREADAFYRAITPAGVGADAANVMRQALAGMLWSKQYFFFDVDKWLEEHGVDPRCGRRRVRCATASGSTWSTTTSSRCRTSGNIPGSPPGIWPFTRIALAVVDVDFAKQQLDLLLRRASTCIRPGRFRPMNGISATSIRRCTPGRRSSSTGRSRRCAAGPTSTSSKRVFGKLTLELHLVGEPQGPLRQERLRGRLPRPRQHRRLRPQRAAADRRLSGAGRRHRVDGAVLPEHARDRRRAGGARPDLRGHGDQVRRAVPAGSPGR